MSLRSTLSALTLALLLGAGPAFAATRLETARAEAKASRAQVVEGKGRQQALRSELNQVSGRIEAMKAKGQSFLTNPELDSQLRRSQELAASLTELAKAVSGAEAKSQASATALLSVINDELNRLRGELDRAQDRNVRKNLITQLRALRDEREQLYAQLPATAVPSLNAGGSDDPEELLEQADALRDSEDKLRAQMKQLQARLQEAKEERELDRSIANFSRDEAMFDDSDRRLRVSKESATKLTVDRAPPLSGDFSSGDKARGGAAEVTAMGTNAPSADPSGFGNPAPDQSAGSPGNRDVNNVARAADAQPQVGKLGATSNEADDIAALEAQLKKMQRQAEELNSRAATLEKKAQEIE